MVRKCLTYFLIAVLCNVQLFAQTKDDKNAVKEAARVEKLKAEIKTIGTGDTAPAEVKLKNGGKLIGYVSEIKDGSIIFAETAIATTREISYTDIHSVKTYKPPSVNKLGKNKKTVLWVSLFAVGMTALGIYAYKRCKRLEREGKTCATDDTTY